LRQWAMDLAVPGKVRMEERVVDDDDDDDGFGGAESGTVHFASSLFLLFHRHAIFGENMCAL